VTIELAAGEDIACTFLNRRVRFPIFLPIIMK
jgi:hypothetical protein